jgi:hypothetical protein
MFEPNKSGFWKVKFLVLGRHALNLFGQDCLVVVRSCFPIARTSRLAPVHRPHSNTGVCAAMMSAHRRIHRRPNAASIDGTKPTN